MRLSDLIGVRLRQGGINDPFLFRAVFMGGGAGSGKTYVTKQMFGGLGLKILASDVQFEFLLKQRSLSLAIDPGKVEQYAKQTAAREHAFKLTAAQQVSWTNGMLGLVIDGTGQLYSKIAGSKEGLDALGYDCGMVFVNTSLEQALEGNRSRDRSLDEKTIQKIWHSTQENLSRYRSLFGKNYFEIKKEHYEKGSPEEEQFGLLARRMALGWLKKPLHNPIGRTIIETLKATGGKLLSDLDLYAMQKAA